MFSFERVLVWIIRCGLVLLLFTPFIVAKGLFFPFITGKNFYFRIIVELIFGVWVALAVLNRNYRPRRGPILIALAVFIFILILATLLGVDPYHSFWSNFERMEGLITHLHVLALFLVFAHSVRQPKEWLEFLIVSLGVSLIVAVYGFLQSTGSVEILGGGRPFAWFGNSIYLAVYLMFHLFFLAIIFVRSRVPWIRCLCAAPFLFEFYVFIQAASRGAFVGFVGGVVIAALLFIFLAESRSYRIAGLVSLFLVGIIVGLIVFAPRNPLIKNSELLQRLSDASLKSVQNDPRVMIWGVALEAVKARPLLGWGPENFLIPYAQFYNPDLFGNEPWFDRAHNMLLEWLVATGIIGFAAYLAIFASAFWTISRLVRANIFSRLEAILIISLFAAYILQNVFVFDNVITYILIAALLAFLHSLSVSSTVIKQNKKMHPAAPMIAVSVVLISIIGAFTLNARPIQAAAGIITSLQALSKGSADAVIGEFEKTIALGTFGTTEARERVTDTVVQVAVNVEQTNAEFNKLLDYSIREMEKEYTQSPSPRIPLFLGKLYTIRANITGQDLDKAEATYQELQKRAPRYVQTYLAMAELYLITGESEKAVRVAETAYQLPTKKETLGALYFPVLSVYVMGGRYDKAVDLIQTHRVRTNTIIFHPVSQYQDIELLIRRTGARGSGDEKLLLFTAMNDLFMQDYGFPQPLIASEIVRLLREGGDHARAQAFIDQYMTAEIKEKARISARESSNTFTESVVKKFLEALESLK